MKYNFKSCMTATLFFFILFSCKKASCEETTKLVPDNLVVNSVVASGGSSTVAFTATATNAVGYDYEFGNGDTLSVPTGIVSYTYKLSGTNTYSVSVTAKSASGLTLKKSIMVTVRGAQSVPSLFWSEEFDLDGAPDPTKWGYDLGAGGWGNNELEYYTNRPENAIVQDGLLKINAIKENYNGSPYTSARLLSKGKFEFKYGTVEIKAKLPAGVGSWPAVWALGSNVATTGWPACGEIDILEHVGKNLNTIYGTLHYPGRSGGKADGGTKLITNSTTEFHIYKLDWSAAAISMYVDDQLIHSVVNSKGLPFNQDFFLILNVAMGGDFGGDIDPEIKMATMEIDYIRIYK